MGSRVVLVKVQLIVEFDPTTGGLSLTGPIDNEMVALYMLEKAKLQLFAYTAAKAQRGGIVVASPGALPQNGKS